MKTSNFKLAYSAEAASAAKAGQTSNKLQGSNLKVFDNLVFGYFLVFGVWFLNFVACGRVVHSTWISNVKLPNFYPLSTSNKNYLTSQVFFIRNLLTVNTPALTHRLLKILSIKFGFYTFYTGPMYTN